VSRYRSAWTVLWGGAATLGVAMGAVIWSPLTVTVLFVLASAVAALVNIGHINDSKAGQQPEDLTGAVAARSAASGLTVAAVAALASAAPALLWPVLLMAVVTHPRAVGAALRLLERAPGGADDGPADLTVAAAIDGLAGPWAHELSDRDLGRAWTKSYESLRAVTDPTLRAGIVTLRQAFLDEIERRNPSGFNAWLASDASAASNPGRHLA